MMHAAIFRFGILLALATLGASTATAQTELFFATGVDSTGWAEAQSNADGQVLIESPQYPRGLWLHLVDEAGDALAGLQVEYQGRPDSLVAIRCVDPVGSVRQTLIWTWSDGDSLRLMLKPTGLDDLPAGLTSIDWQIDPTARALLEPVNETRLIGWEAVASFLQAHWQYQTGRVLVQLNASASFAVELDRPETIETLVVHLQQMYRPAETSLGKSTVLNVQVLSGGSALQEGVILYLPLFADANLERVVREALGRHGHLTPEDVSFMTSISAYNDSISSLAGLENCTALDTLILARNQITDITPLANLNNLQELGLSSNQITDITPLANLNNLRVLWLDWNQIAEVGPLANLNNLQKLGLESSQITDITPLANLNNLQELWLRYNQIADTTPLVNLNNLQKLYLSSNQITDITPLANLNNLQVLELRRNQITDVTPLANLNNLRQLGLVSNQITDITPLANLNNLSQWLYLNDNQITDITPLANLNNLRALNLHNNQITDITPLANLNNLRALSLHSNQITDITPLANLNNLQSLWLHNNQIAEVGPLADLTDLHTLRLHDNQIAEVGPLAGLYNLERLSLGNNQIEDISALVANASLGEGDEIHLTGNPLSDKTRNEQIPALQARGVDVTY